MFGKHRLIVGLHWISGLFCYPVSGRISGYRYRITGRPDTGYPAKYQENKNKYLMKFYIEALVVKDKNPH